MSERVAIIGGGKIGEALLAGLINAGQVCTSTERLYVHESIYGRFSEELADFVGKLRLGNGLDQVALEGVAVGAGAGQHQGDLERVDPRPVEDHQAGDRGQPAAQR